MPDPDQEQSSPDDLAGRCAVVTGAANGIGLAIARQLWRAGANVITVDKDEQRLKEHFDGVPRFGWITHDFAESDDWYFYIGDIARTNGDAIAAKVLDQAFSLGFGPPSLIVNNVGAQTDHGFLELDSTDREIVYRVNLGTPWYLTRRLVKEFLKLRADHPEATPECAAILFVSSLHDTVPSGRPHYSTSKAAIAMLTRELAWELGQHRIRVNAISPGWIRTNPDPSSAEQRAKERALVPRIPLRRPGTPDDVAGLALILLSDRCSGYLTGVSIPVDGGLSLDTWTPPHGTSWDQWYSVWAASPTLEPAPVGLEGRCAMVTGAARGIGLAIAQHLRSAGADVIAVDKDEQGLKEHFDGTQGYARITHDFALGDEHFSADGSITNGEALAERVLDRARACGFALPSLIVNNAAGSTPSGYLNLEPDDHDSIYRVIVRTPWYLTRRLVDEFRKAHANQPAAILFIGSIHETVPARRPHYSASKAAVAQFVRESALELGEYKIRVNAISPGWIRTDPDPSSAEQRAKERALVPRIPLRRPGTPDDIARIAVALLSATWSGYVTGVNVPVDGGLSLDTWMPPPGVPWDAWR